MLFLIFSFSNFKAIAQTTVSFPDIGVCEAILIDYDNLPDKYKMGRYDLTVKDIIMAEEILKRDIKTSDLNLNKMKRQYAGYINNEGEPCIIINLINSKKLSKRFLMQWNNVFVSGNGGIHEYIVSYCINLKSNIIFTN